MQFFLDARSGVPLYVQLKDQIKYQIASGKLAPGIQLPTVRQLAVELRINPNTVAKVYAELEADGVLVTQRGRGTFVAEAVPPRDLDELRQLKLRPLVQRCLTEGLSLGFSISDVRKAIEEELEAWEKHEYDS